jgi:hypothetical protein
LLWTRELKRKLNPKKLKEGLKNYILFICIMDLFDDDDAPPPPPQQQQQPTITASSFTAALAEAAAAATTTTTAPPPPSTSIIPSSSIPPPSSFQTFLSQQQQPQQHPSTSSVRVVAYCARLEAHPDETRIPEEYKKFYKHQLTCTDTACSEEGGRCSKIRIGFKHWKECDKSMCRDCIEVDAERARFVGTDFNRYDKDLDEIRTVKRNIAITQDSLQRQKAMGGDSTQIERLKEELKLLLRSYTTRLSTLKDRASRDLGNDLRPALAAHVAKTTAQSLLSLQQQTLPVPSSSSHPPPPPPSSMLTALFPSSTSSTVPPPPPPPPPPPRSSNTDTKSSEKSEKKKKKSTSIATATTGVTTTTTTTTTSGDGTKEITPTTTTPPPPPVLLLPGEELEPFEQEDAAKAEFSAECDILSTAFNRIKDAEMASKRDMELLGLLPFPITSLPSISNTPATTTTTEKDWKQDCVLGEALMNEIINELNINLASVREKEYIARVVHEAAVDILKGAHILATHRLKSNNKLSSPVVVITKQDVLNYLSSGGSIHQNGSFSRFVLG